MPRKKSKHTITKRDAKERINEMIQELQSMVSKADNGATKSFLQLYTRDSAICLKLHDQRTK